MMAHARAVLDADAIRLVDEDTQQTPPAGPIKIHQLVSQPRQCRIQQPIQIHRESMPQTKNGRTAHLDALQSFEV
jgi:hypothetical protein